MATSDTHSQLARDHLREYVTTHLAGAEAATRVMAEIADRLDDEDLHRLHEELQEDMGVLHQTLESLGLEPGTIKQALANVGERISEVPRAALGITQPELRDLLDLETLITGIEGKRALWRSLLAIRASSPVIDSIPLEDLDERAERQYHTVEARRIEVAQRALVER